MNTGVPWLSALTGIGVIGALLALIGAAWAWREARRTRYLIVRRAAERRARRWFWLALGLALGTGALNAFARSGFHLPFEIPPPGWPGPASPFPHTLLGGPSFSIPHTS